jgi:hypothetical protein
MNSQYIKLDAEDFKCLVSGGVLKINMGNGFVSIILADIGFERMHNILDSIEDNEEFYQDRER